jgi:hypothetical protein
VNSIPQLAPDEPLSPELVLVLPPELRAQALAALGAPAWPKPRPPHALERPAPVPEPAPGREPAPVREPFTRSVATVLAGRAVQFAVIFLTATAVTLAMALVAHAVR